MGDKKKAAKAEKAKAKKTSKAETAAPETLTATGIVEELREAGAKIVAAANSPAGREAIAVGLTIAATAAQAAIAAKRQSGAASPAEGSKTDTAGAKPAAANGHEALTAALSGVAETVLTRLFPAKRG